MKRIRNFDGTWGYCRKCGNRAYQSCETYALCGHSCGYIQESRDIVYQSKNTEKFDYLAYWRRGVE